MWPALGRRLMEVLWDGGDVDEVEDEERGDAWSAGGYRPWRKARADECSTGTAASGLTRPAAARLVGHDEPVGRSGTGSSGEVDGLLRLGGAVAVAVEDVDAHAPVSGATGVGGQVKDVTLHKEALASVNDYLDCLCSSDLGIHNAFAAWKHVMKIGQSCVLEGCLTKNTVATIVGQ